MSDGYRPNHIPLFDRINTVFSSLTILTLGSFFLVDNGFVLSKPSGWGWTFPSVVGNLFVFSMLLSVVTLLTKVADHYDRRNNELKYQRFAQASKIISMILFTWGGIGAIFEWQFQNHPPEKSSVEPYTLALFLTGVFVSVVYFAFTLHEEAKAERAYKIDRYRRKAEQKYLHSKMMPIGQAPKFSATTAEILLSKEEPVCDSEGKIHGFQIERHIRCPDGEYFYYLGDTEKYSFRPISQGVAQAILGKRYKPAKLPENPSGGMNEKAADSIH